MAQFDKIVQRAAEKLYEDEQVRSNLTDDEAKVVLDWAVGWITERVSAAWDEATAQQVAQNELARVRQTANALNALAAKPGTLNLAEAVAALQPSLQAQGAMPRETVFQLLTELLTALWRAQGE